MWSSFVLLVVDVHIFLISDTLKNWRVDTRPNFGVPVYFQ